MHHEAAYEIRQKYQPVEKNNIADSNHLNSITRRDR